MTWNILSYPATQAVTNTPAPNNSPKTNPGLSWPMPASEEKTSGAPLPSAIRVTPAMFWDNLYMIFIIDIIDLKVWSLPQYFWNYFNRGTEIVISRYSQSNEDHKKPYNQEYYCQGKQWGSHGAIDEGDVVDEAINVQTFFIVLHKITSEHINKLLLEDNHSVNSKYHTCPSSRGMLSL